MPDQLFCAVRATTTALRKSFRLARETLVLVPLGLPFFIPLAFASRLGLGFWPALGAGIVLMHMKGTPSTMQREPTYADVTAEVLAFLDARVAAAREAGVAPERVFIDPGIGFGKSFAHNETLLSRLESFTADGRRTWIGASRKGFLGAITGRPPAQRLAASLACVARAFEARAFAVRVHDVAATFDLLETLDRIRPKPA